MVVVVFVVVAVVIVVVVVVVVAVVATAISFVVWPNFSSHASFSFVFVYIISTVIELLGI